MWSTSSNSTGYSNLYTFFLCTSIKNHKKTKMFAKNTQILVHRLSKKCKFKMYIKKSYKNKREKKIKCFQYRIKIFIRWKFTPTLILISRVNRQKRWSGKTEQRPSPDYHPPVWAVSAVGVKNPLKHGSQHDTRTFWLGQRHRYQGD